MKLQVLIIALALTISPGMTAGQENTNVDYLRWTPQKTEAVGKSTYHDGKVGQRWFDTRGLKTDRSMNYKLRVTWFTPDVIRASARWAQIHDGLTDGETQVLVSEAESAGDTIFMVEMDPLEGSGVIPSDWSAILQPKGSTGPNDSVRGVDKTFELRRLRALQGVIQRNYDYDRFWVAFPLTHHDGNPVIGPDSKEVELVVRVYNKEGAVTWSIPQSILLRKSSLKATTK